VTQTVTSMVTEALPRLRELVGDRALRTRRDEFETLGLPLLWQTERDLHLLGRKVPAEHVRRAYQSLLRNADQFLDAAYEIRAAAMLVPFVDAIELSPKIGSSRCDMKCRVHEADLFVEVSAHTDAFPARYDGTVYARTTVDKAFAPTNSVSEPSVRATPAATELRQRIMEELKQLPKDGLTLLVLGAKRGRSLDLEAALWGDEIIVASSEAGWRHERVANGLFAIEDAAGGASGLSAVAWLKLSPQFHDVLTHSRLFTNSRARAAIPPVGQNALRQVFDRRAVLQEECQRIVTVLLTSYRPERLILFGSLADDSRDTVHQWSDIDLAVVKQTPLSFVERSREVVDLVEPRVSLNVLVYTPDEFERLMRDSRSFVRTEILEKGRALFPLT
jgi:predicted nucleotidyltransferase